MTTALSAREFYDEQIRFIETQDIDGIASHYTEDAVLIRFDNQIRGREAIREYFVGYLAGMPGLKLKSTDQFAAIEDAIFFEATVTMDAGEARVYDAFAMKDGLIHRHFTGLLGFTPKA